ncbi:MULTISPECIES: hypothetical protein [Yersiniaceae]|uniref:Uncharacterized protein n=1 Tax=Nissabacter archeti TaxID=1917880 RepID=A0ABS5JM44_9GAMM|nr:MULTISPECIES: hypothetical protein [Yersiniaceae]MBS0970959.1 hypothetical protein [Nissabacter archeti]MDV5139105.1 hypothetical protein [Chimaeribacter arupi]WKZ90666.1 hypothetical protein P0E69_10260 [Chimaeribacter arupi]
MRYGRRAAQPEEKIDYQAIRAGKAAMVKRFMAAKAEAERQGNVVIKPL